jgi:hypothetical protein
MSEFNWWLLIVGLVIGAGLVWLILADSQRRESEISQAELPAEAAWIAETLEESGEDVNAETAERVLRLHRAYLASLPPDEVDEVDEVDDVDEVDARWDEDSDEEGLEERLQERPEVPPIKQDQPLDPASPGTTPVWTATEPSPRRR